MIQIQLPKESLIKSVWWSAPNGKAYIFNIELFRYQEPTSLGGNQRWTNSLNGSTITKSSDFNNLTIKLFPNPILTQILILDGINVYSESPNTQFVNFQIEIFGCESYKLDEGI